MKPLVSQALPAPAEPSATASATTSALVNPRTEAKNSGAALPLPEDPSAFTLSANHESDLTEAVRQYTALAVPMKPLCQADCAGICPTCGQNLNQGACACPPPEGDTRREKLQKLLGK